MEPSGTVPETPISLLARLGTVPKIVATFMEASGACRADAKDLG
jgi:hypothetical protein